MKFVEFLKEDVNDVTFKLNGNTFHVSQDEDYYLVKFVIDTKDHDVKGLYNEALSYLLKLERLTDVTTYTISNDLTIEFSKKLYDVNKIKSIISKAVKSLPTLTLKDLYIKNSGSGGTLIKMGNIESSEDDAPLCKYINEFIKEHNYEGKIKPSPIKTIAGKMVLDRDRTNLGLIILAMLNYKKEEFDFEEYGGKPRTGNGDTADAVIKPHINPIDADRLRQQNFKSMWNK